jgi:hypothetical protein
MLASHKLFVEVAALITRDKGMKEPVANVNETPAVRGQVTAAEALGDFKRFLPLSADLMERI